MPARREEGSPHSTGRCVNSARGPAKHLAALLAAVCMAAAASPAATVTTAGSGNWNSTTPGAPWPGGTVPAANSDIVIDNGHTVTITAAVTASPGNLTVNAGGQLTVGGFNLTVNGATVISGTISNNSTAGAKTHTGDLTINSGGLWIETAAETFTFGGSFRNDGTFTALGGSHTFSGAGKSFSGSNPIALSILLLSGSYTNNGTLSPATLTVNGSIENASTTTAATVNGSGTCLNNGTMTVTTTLGGTVSLTQGATTSAVLTLGNTVTASLTASGAGNTVIYSRANPQLVKPVTYHNLTLAGSGAKTSDTVTVNGVLSMEGTATATTAIAYGPAAALRYNTATARTAGPEWITPFEAAGGVALTNTGAITLNGDKVLGASVPLAVCGGATLDSGGQRLTLGGAFDNAGAFLAREGTVEWSASGPQNVASGAYYNAVFSGSGAKALVAGTRFGGELSIAPSGSAKASVGDGLAVSVSLLRLGGTEQARGTWGSTSAPDATHQDDVYFEATTGYLDVLYDPAVVTWRGTGDWFADTANWSNGLPGPGSNVWIASGTVLLTSAPPALASFAIGAPGSPSTVTLVFTNWATCLTADEAAVREGGLLTLPAAFAGGAMSNRVWVVCTNFALASGGRIDSSGRGFRGAYRAAGSGPGAGAATPSGAGHGGNGLGVGPGLRYEAASAPTAPGSGGGGQASGSATGGAGGGAVRIEAGGNVDIRGTIGADGASATGGTDGGGGSGGSISIACATVTGDSSALLSARGGGPSPYAGAGGRIAVAYDPVRQAGQYVPIRFNAMPGAGNKGDGMGSLFLPDATWVVDPFSRLEGVWLFGGVTGWTADTMSVSGSIGFGETNVQVSIAGDVRVDGSNTLGLSAYSSLSCSNLLLTNGGSLTVYAGMVAVPGSAVSTTNCGALVSAADTLWVGPGSWVYPYSLYPPYTGVKNTNGVGVLFQAGNVLVAGTNAGFNANGSGHPGGTDRSANTWGNGAGGSSGRGYGVYADGEGGSHGGRGGNNTHGAIYGSSNAPVFPGSGGAAGWTGSGADGGGVVWIWATNDVVVNGSITADGGPQGGRQTSPQSCGAAGGSVFIACKAFSGGSNALLSAEGSSASGGRSGGGGGRVAVAVGLGDENVAKLLRGETVDGLIVYDQHADYKGAVSVTNGLATNNPPATPGTALFETVSGAAVSLSIVGSPANYGAPAPLGYGTYLNLDPGTRMTNGVASPANETAGVRRSCLGWELRDMANALLDSGATTQAVIEIATDATLTWRWTNEYRLTVCESAGGTVNSNAHNGWYTNGTEVTGIAAATNPGYRFYEWVDAVPAAARFDNPLTLTMDQPRTVTASFFSEAGETRVWSGTGAWESSTNWSPAGMAGPFDAALLRSGTCVLGQPRTVSTLAISNGATLVFTNWSTVLTGTTVTVQSGGRIDLPAAFGNAGPSNRIHVACETLTIETGAVVSAAAKGYAGSPSRGIRGSGPGWGDSSSGGAGGGGSHGGQGAYYTGITAGGGIYGDTNMPLAPGSGGGAGWSWAGGAGGGAIRIEASTALILNGTLTANGQDGTGGGGSGGSISIACGALSGGPAALLTARGGNSTSEGAGGGGRVAVYYGGGRHPPTEGVYPVDFLGAVSVTNGTDAKALTPPNAAAPGTIKWFYSKPPLPGTVLIVR